LLNLLKLLGARGCRAPATRGSVGRSRATAAALACGVMDVDAALPTGAGCGPVVGEASNEFLLLVGCMELSVVSGTK
jgi:hypothetical protein